MNIKYYACIIISYKKNRYQMQRLLLLWRNDDEHNDINYVKGQNDRI